MPRHSLRLFVYVIVLSVTTIFQPAPASAQSGGSAQTNGSANPSPRAVLGFSPGDDRKVADWRQIVNYFQALDVASDRIELQTIGETTQRRPLIAAFISAPENIRNLSKYREIQRKLADPRTIVDEAERMRLLSEGKTVVVISCSIHSDEIVASQMSMQLAYELATSEDKGTREILQNTILILIPSANPDGIQLVADWYRKTLGTPYEGSAPPELYHHYAGHDNNRDWFMLNLRETQLLTRLFWKEWFPQIVFDMHQQGRTAARFVVPPYSDPANPHIAPLLLDRVGVIGHKVAADLREAGFKGITSKTVYDTWWHGGFRTAPYYHNSIGILSEAASADLMTPININGKEPAKGKVMTQRRALEPPANSPDPWPGGLWRPRDIMNMEMMAARSVLSMAARLRTEYLRDFYELGRANSSAPPAGQPLAYLIPAGQGNDESVAKMLDALIKQGVEVHRLDRELHVTAARQDYGMEEAPAGSYIIFLAQPYRSNVLALFEPQVYPERRSSRTGELERPYDVAGWTLPMQMGIETVPLMAIREAAADRRLTLNSDAQEVRRDLGLPLQRAAASPVNNPVTRPVRLAVYKGWTAAIDEGWTRFVFDTFNVPYKSLRDQDVRRGNLRRQYDVIVLPSQRVATIINGNSPGSYPPQFTGGMTEKGVESLRRFVNEGGTLICFDASSELAIKRFNLPLRNVLEGVKSSDFYCPGSILRINLDKTHAITRGMPRAADAYFINSSAFELTDAATSRVRVIARYAERDVLRSGWLLGESRIAGRIALAEVSLGRGRVILFAFRPQHRGQTWGTFPLIFNSLNQ